MEDHLRHSVLQQARVIAM